MFPITNYWRFIVEYLNCRSFSSSNLFCLSIRPWLICTLMPMTWNGSNTSCISTSKTLPIDLAFYISNLTRLRNFVRKQDCEQKKKPKSRFDVFFREKLPRKNESYHALLEPWLNEQALEPQRQFSFGSNFVLTPEVLIIKIGSVLSYPAQNENTTHTVSLWFVYFFNQKTVKRLKTSNEWHIHAHHL